MRLLRTDRLEIIEFVHDQVPKYAILSHTWGEGEVSLHDVQQGLATSKSAFSKVIRCCARAKADGFDYVWIDTCCIDNTSSAELSEAINSMYLWYFKAEVCYAYLADVLSEAGLVDSRWFTRGWTLQELIAPSQVYFVNRDWEDLGTKENLQQILSDHTGIPIAIVSGRHDFSTASVAQRMSWAAHRETTRVEDRAYCLMGLFSINMPLIYGEGERAFIRLQEEIMRVSDDHSLFAWRSPDNRGGLMATSPAAFAASHNIVQFKPLATPNGTATISGSGIHLELRFIGRGRRGLGVIVLHCKEKGPKDEPMAIWVRDSSLNMELFERVWTERLDRLDLSRFRPTQRPVRKMCIQRGRLAPTRNSGHVGQDNGIAEDDVYDNHTLTTIMAFGQPTALPRAIQRGLENIVWLLLTRSDIEPLLQHDDDGHSVLSRAVMGGHETVVKILLSRTQNADQLEARDVDGMTPLMRAVESGNAPVVKLLLDKGADMEVKSTIGQTVLIQAISNRTGLLHSISYRKLVDAKLLLDKGADTQAKSQSSRATLPQGMTPRPDHVIELLVEKGANIEVRGPFGRTPLFQAVNDGNEPLIKILLNKGANVEARDVVKRTPLFQAVDGGRMGAVELLLDGGADIEAGDFASKQTPLARAAALGLEPIVALLLERGAYLEAKDSKLRTPLQLAKFSGNQAVSRLLLDKGADAAYNHGSHLTIKQLVKQLNGVVSFGKERP